MMAGNNSPKRGPKSGNPAGRRESFRNKAAKTKRKAKRTAKAVAKPHERTPEEIAFMRDFEARKTAKPEIPKITLEMNDDGETRNLVVEVQSEDPDLSRALMYDAFGTTDARFFDGLSKQLVRAGEHDFEFMVSIVAGLEPRDQIEAMLAAQMATVHTQIMTYARRLTIADTLMECEIAEKSFNKLVRTFTVQMEALNRHRSKGQQKMTVEHVHIHEGGQAIVGNVQGGGKK